MVDLTTSPTKRLASFPSLDHHLMGVTNRSTSAQLRPCPLAGSVAIVGRPALATLIIHHPCKATSQFQRLNYLHHYQFKPTLPTRHHHSARQHSQAPLRLRFHRTQFHITVGFPRSAIALSRAWLVARNL